MTATPGIIVKSDGSGLIGEVLDANIVDGDQADGAASAGGMADYRALEAAVEGLTREMLQAASAAVGLGRAMRQAAGSSSGGGGSGGGGDSGDAGEVPFGGDALAGLGLPSPAEALPNQLAMLNVRMVEPAQEAADTIALSFESAGRRVGAAIGGMVAEGEFDLEGFKGIALDLLGDIAEAFAQQFRLPGGFGGGLGGGSGGPFGDLAGILVSTLAGLAHEGGVIGRDGLPVRYLDGRLFTGAPGFAGGGVIGSDEVPILAHAGQGVFTPGQMAALGAGAAERGQGSSAPPVTVNLHVSPGVPEAVRREFIKLIPQIKEIAKQAVLESISRNGPIRRKLEGR